MEIAFDIETTGLEPLRDRVTAIGLKSNKEELIITHKEEKLILEEFWEYLRKNNVKRLVGFNCKGFDVPFLLIRSLKHNVRCHDLKWKVTDLRYILGYGNGYRKGKLDEFCKMIGSKGKCNGWCGQHIPLLWQEGKIDSLVEYVLIDVRMTYDLFKKCKELNMIW